MGGEGARIIAMAGGGAAIGSIVSPSATIVGAVLGVAFAVLLFLLDLREDRDHEVEPRSG